MRITLGLEIRYLIQTGCKGWAKFFDKARRYSKLFGDGGGKNRHGWGMVKKDARRTPGACLAR